MTQKYQFGVGPASGEKTVMVLDGRMPLRYTGGMNRLRLIREAKGLTQQQLADVVIPPTSQAQIDRLEKSQRKLTREWAQRLARALGCDWFDFFEDHSAEKVTPQEQAMLDLFRQLPQEERSRIMKVASALAQPADDVDGLSGDGTTG